MLFRCLLVLPPIAISYSLAVRICCCVRANLNKERPMQLVVDAARRGVGYGPIGRPPSDLLVLPSCSFPSLSIFLRKLVSAPNALFPVGIVTFIIHQL